MNTRAKNEAIAHANSLLNEEVCGIFYAANNTVNYQPCKNYAAEPTLHFEIDPREFLDAKQKGLICGIFHSHIKEFSSNGFSEDDIYCSEETMIPFHLLDNGNWYEYLPKSEDVQVLKLPFAWGIYDCLGLVRNYYRKHFGIVMNDYDRDETYENSTSNQILENFDKEDFIPVKNEAIRIHDVLLFDSHRAFPHHLAVFIGNSKMAHHPLRSFSLADQLTSRWTSKIRMVLRHKSLV